MQRYAVNSKKGAYQFMEEVGAPAGRLLALKDREEGHEGRTVISLETVAAQQFYHEFYNVASKYIIAGSATTARRRFIMAFRNGYANRPATCHTALVTM